jgi:hypothetical protein
MTINAPYMEVVTFAGIFKDILEVNNAKYNAKYYNKPEFEEVKRSLKEIKGIIKK